MESSNTKAANKKDAKRFIDNIADFISSQL